MKPSYFQLCKEINFMGPLSWENSGGCGENTGTPLFDDIEIFHHAARMDCPEKLKSMIEAGSVDIEATTARFDETALHVAAENGSYSSVEVLLAAGADIKRRNCNGETALHCCARSMGGSIVSLLLDNDAFADDTDDDGNTVFHTAANSYTEQVLRNLIEHPKFSKTSLERRNNENLTPVLVAAKEACEDRFLQLLEVSDDISGTSSVSGLGIIHFSLNMSLETFKVVLSKDIDHGLKDGWGRTALHICCKRSFPCEREKLSLLINRGLDPCAVDNRGKTPLRTLLDNKTSLGEDEFRHFITQVATPASVHLKDGEGNLPLFYFLRHTPVHSKTVSAFRVFLDIGVDLCDRDASGKSCLEALMEAGSSLEMMPWVLSQYTDLFLEVLEQPSVSYLLEEDDIALRLLIWAVQRSQEILVDKLLDHVDDVYKAISSEGNKSLLEVGIASRTSIPIFEKLLSKASLETLAQLLPDSGQTLIHVCCNTKTLADVQYLETVIRAGVDVNATCQPTLLTGLMLAAEAGSTSHIQTLLNHGAEMMKVDSDGWTALHFAACHDSVSVLQAFGDFEIDRIGPATFTLETYSYEAANPTFIHFVTPEPSILEYVLDKFPSIDVGCVDELGQTPLHIAAASESIGSVRLLVSRGASVSTQSSDGKTALHLASIYERSDIIDFLISKGADVDSSDTDGWTPLHHAAHRGLHTVVQQLLEYGANNIPSIRHSTPEILAMLGGYFETAAMIWNHGKEWIDEKDKPAETKAAGVAARKALYNSISDGSQETVEQILECYTDLDEGHEGCCGCSPTLLALKLRNSELADLLICKGFTLCGEICTAGTYPGASALHLALLDDSLSDALRLALSRSNREDFHTGHAIHPLHFAVGQWNYTGLLCLIRHYLRLGTEPVFGLSDIDNLGSASVQNMATLAHNGVFASESDVLDSNRKHTILNIAMNSRRNRGPYEIDKSLTADILDGSTPLHVAALVDNDDAARLLVRFGANIESQTNELATPLHFAASSGSISVLKFLLTCGANVYSRDSQYMTPTMYTVRGGHLEALILLENYGVEITQTARSDHNLLELALKSSSVSMLAYLLEKGCPSTKSTIGDFPIAMLWGSQIQTISLALNSTMTMVEDANHIDQLGAYQLISAGKTSLLKKLLKRISDKNHCRVIISSEDDYSKQTPLYAAVIAGSVDVMALLVDFGADIEVESEEIGTPLMAACAAGRLCAVEYLVRQGARETYANHERSFSALEEARHFPEIRRWLLVGRYTQQRKLENGSVGGLESDGRGFWAGPKTLKVPLTRQWGRFGNESTLDHVRRLSVRKGELEGEILSWPEGAEHPFVMFS